MRAINFQAYMKGMTEKRCLRNNNFTGEGDKTKKKKKREREGEKTKIK